MKGISVVGRVSPVSGTGWMCAGSAAGGCIALGATSSTLLASTCSAYVVYQYVTCLVSHE